MRDLIRAIRRCYTNHPTPHCSHHRLYYTHCLTTALHWVSYLLCLSPSCLLPPRENFIKISPTGLKEWSAYVHRCLSNSQSKMTPEPSQSDSPPPFNPSTTPSPERLVGLQVLYEPKTQSTNVQTVNLIFVHGLGGSLKDTWTHSSGTFWPALLHEDDRFANVRICAFGYDANFKDILAAKNVLGIRDFAKQLLNAFDLHCDNYGDVTPDY